MAMVRLRGNWSPLGVNQDKDIMSSGRQHSGKDRLNCGGYSYSSVSCRHFCSSSLEVGCGRLELLNFIVWIEGGDGSSSVPRDKDLALQDRDLAPPNPD
ncbi:unnamed protein product [Boreogadus saida]